ncbi:MAG: CBS domain-containing protein, partial [Phycisphaerales bacterium]|nr:CBS domain-containing protein [Phycisphaerales bacterium]
KLAELCDVHVPIGDITEACPMNLAPTASTTAQLAIGDALALAVSRRREFGEDEFQRHHPGGMLGVGLRRVTEIVRFRVGENLPVIRDDVSLREALKAANAVGATMRRAGAMLFVDAGGRLSGIFTDGDLRRRITEGSGIDLDVPVRSVMTVRPQHLTVDDLVRDAVRLVRERRVDEIPVIDADGRPIGLVDVQDLLALKVVTE